jgi:hypothetical protein
MSAESQDPNLDIARARSSALIVNALGPPQSQLEF